MLLPARPPPLSLSLFSFPSLCQRVDKQTFGEVERIEDEGNAKSSLVNQGIGVELVERLQTVQ